MIHLVCGPIGAGKTTVAHQIAEEFGAIRFSEDEWLSQLFVPDAPKDLMQESMDVIGEWATEKYQRCRTQIWDVCELILSRGGSVVIDGAAANEEQRNIIRQKARDHDIEFQLHYVNCDSETRRHRVFARNLDKSDTFSLEVTVEMFEHMEVFFEPPSARELVGARVVET